MAPADFPDAPIVGEQFTAGVRTWEWDGSTWRAVVSPGPTGPTGPASTVEGPTGPTGPEGPTGPTGPQGVWDTAQTISEKAADYTLVAGDAGYLLKCTQATAQTITIPDNATEAFSIGQRVDIIQYGDGQVTIAGAAGVTLQSTPTSKLRAKYSTASIIKIDTDEWVLAGDLALG